MNTPITSTGESSLGGHRSVDAGFFPDYSEAGLSVLKRRHFRESRKGLGKMKKLRFLLFMVLVLIAHPRVSQCDVSQDETVDVHFVTNEVPGLFPCKVNFY